MKNPFLLIVTIVTSMATTLLTLFLIQSSSLLNSFMNKTSDQEKVIESKSESFDTMLDVKPGHPTTEGFHNQSDTFSELSSFEGLVTGLEGMTFRSEQHKVLEYQVDSLRKEVQLFRDKSQVVPTEVLAKFDNSVTTLNTYLDSNAQIDNP